VPKMLVAVEILARGRSVSVALGIAHVHISCQSEQVYCTAPGASEAKVSATTKVSATVLVIKVQRTFQCVC
jgi:tRNA(Met) C34 N-acetyltransferase TmcA